MVTLRICLTIEIVTSLFRLSPTLQERKEAVENRRKQEEEQRVRRLQQIDEERTMAEELLKKRQLQEVRVGLVWSLLWT